MASGHSEAPAATAAGVGHSEAPAAPGSASAFGAVGGEDPGGNSAVHWFWHFGGEDNLANAGLMSVVPPGLSSCRPRLCQVIASDEEMPIPDGKVSNLRLPERER